MSTPPPLRPPPPTTVPLTTTTTAAAASASTSSPAPAAFSLYSHPQLYDAAFAFRDFDAEAQFLVDAWEAFGKEGSKEPLSSFLDIGCGPGKHGAALARLLLSDGGGSGPLSLFALDSSAEMLAAAAAAASEAGCPLERAIRTDMTAAGGSFNIEGFTIDGRVQLALCALGTLAHALAAPADSSPSVPDPALNVLRAACAALVPGGLLVLELPAAGDLFDGTLLAGDAWDVPAGAWQRGTEEGRDGDEGQRQQQPAEQQEKRRIGQIVPPKKLKKDSSSSSPALIVEYGSPDDAFDPVAQVLFRTVVVSEARGDGSAGREVGRETVAQRLFSPGEVRALAREAGFAVAAELGDMELRGSEEGKDPPLTAQEGDRYVAVLVKKS